MYRKMFKILNEFFRADQIFKYGFNLSPMYRRTVGKIKEVSKDLHHIKVVIPLNYKNRNYTGTIFGGSLFSATDPIYMIQLLQILGDKYIVWDKKATIKYKKPARAKTIAVFQFSEQEIEEIRLRVSEMEEINVEKQLNLTSEKGEIYAELEKTLYVANKEYYKQKMASRK